jgi:hypothetical protein
MSFPVHQAVSPPNNPEFDGPIPVISQALAVNNRQQETCVLPEQKVGGHSLD